MRNNYLPRRYKGYPLREILMTWEEIKGEGTRASEDLIMATSLFMRDYRLGKFNNKKQPVKRAGREKQKGKGTER